MEKIYIINFVGEVIAEIFLVNIIDLHFLMLRDRPSVSDHETKLLRSS